MTYVQFMDTHVRVSVSMDGVPKRNFAVIDEGVNMNATLTMLNGNTVTIKVEGHPRSVDPIVTTTQLVNFVLDNYNTIAQS
jgi:hypothetical protein